MDDQRSLVKSNKKALTVHFLPLSTVSCGVAVNQKRKAPPSSKKCQLERASHWISNSHMSSRKSLDLSLGNPIALGSAACALCRSSSLEKGHHCIIMGMLLTKVWAQLFGPQEVRVLILGLDNAGKTTILYKLYAPDRVVRTIPTIGFNVEQVKYENLNFSVWDLGGQTSIRPYWRCYYHDTDAVIYVVDSADRDRLGLARKELWAVLEEEELKDAQLLVFANKQDQKNAASASEVASALGLHNIKNRQWYICKSAAVSGMGLQEGLSWLANAIKGNR
eukprot:g38424.t1